MDDLTTLAQIVAVFAVTILPLVLVIWFLAGRDPDPVSDVIVSPRMPWPRGVQEEEPTALAVRTVHTARRVGRHVSAWDR